MQAHVAAARDSDDNPHAHVMVTSLPWMGTGLVRRGESGTAPRCRRGGAMAGAHANRSRDGRREDGSIRCDREMRALEPWFMAQR